MSRELLLTKYGIFPSMFSPYWWQKIKLILNDIILLENKITELNQRITHLECTMGDCPDCEKTLEDDVCLNKTCRLNCEMRAK